MKYMAHIVDQKVVSVSVWDGQKDWQPKEEVVEIPTEKRLDEKTGETKVLVLAGVGWDYVDGEFIDNRPTEYPEDN